MNTRRSFFKSLAMLAGMAFSKPAGLIDRLTTLLPPKRRKGRFIAEFEHAHRPYPYPDFNVVIFHKRDTH